MPNTKTPGNLLGVVRHVLFVIKCIYFHRRYREMPFPKMLCSIVVVQLLLWPELGSTEDAGVHLQLTRLYDVSPASYSWLASASLWATHHTWCRLGSLDHDLTSIYSGGVSSHMAAEVGGGWDHLRIHGTWSASPYWKLSCCLSWFQTSVKCHDQMKHATQWRSLPLSNYKVYSNRQQSHYVTTSYDFPTLIHLQ